MTNQTNYSFFVGIDMSKSTFDAGILDGNGDKIGHKKFTNNQLGFESFLTWVFFTTNSQEILFTMEYTGVYSRKLWMFLQDHDCKLWMESGFQISRGSGIKKTKNDKVDSYSIAEYAFNRKNKAKITAQYDENIFLLHDILSNRNRLVEALKSIETPLAELKGYGGELSVKVLPDLNIEAIKGLKASKIALEKQIDELMNQQPDWKTNFDLVCSVIGVGKWLASWMIVYTRNFAEEFNARKFASLAGVAPFESTSGTTINKGEHVSHFSHQFLKGVLHITAMSAIRYNPVLKQYHAKKRKEGKKGYLALNNVKNKVLQTIFAVINSKIPFDKNYKHKLVA